MAATAPIPIRQPDPEQFNLPALHPRQQEVFADPNRFKVVTTGRQFGKTHLGAVMCVAAALRGQQIWWVAPTFDLTERGWKVILQLVGKIPDVRSEGRPVWRVTIPATGGSIQARSADNPDSLRGSTLNGLVFDEAAQAKPEAWPILRPTLSVKRGWAMFISTPKGLNWFHDLYQDAEAREGWARWRFPSVDSPYLDEDEIATARHDMSALIFSQEYLAEFIAGGESQFHADWIQHYRSNLTDDERYFTLGDSVVALSDCSTFHTVDLAWSLAEDADYTVISSWAVTKKKHLILLDVARGHYEGPDIVPRLRRAYDRWGGVLVVERATRQMSIIQEAVRTGLPIHEVRAEKDKVTRSWPAQARMEQRTVWFPERSTPWYPEIEEELLAFPVARHDDFVDTLSYAALHIARRSSGEVVWI
jgi:predicted phage terminase large subunit-like protein